MARLPGRAGSRPLPCRGSQDEEGAGEKHMAEQRGLSEEQGLWRDIVEAPEEDAPRLVYADLLDENGQPERAEFIRLQVEHARLDPDDARRQELRLREEELLSAHGAEWSAH